ncbi:hypothetical protein EVAR_9645_1 [Eumeta japonica]|uniref:Uncharacterized protein n=1 Tax=Eumeta variegata TaxID=151549 RepID=A0A4C1TL17_EUMVA|nr:hypothetical protein EVAR_9645_1 [Eumeta japonica]
MLNTAVRYFLYSPPIKWINEKPVAGFSSYPNEPTSYEYTSDAQASAQERLRNNKIRMAAVFQGSPNEDFEEFYNNSSLATLKHWSDQQKEKDLSVYDKSGETYRDSQQTIRGMRRDSGQLRVEELLYEEPFRQSSRGSS